MRAVTRAYKPGGYLSIPITLQGARVPITMTAYREGMEGDVPFSARLDGYIYRWLGGTDYVVRVPTGGHDYYDVRLTATTDYHAGTISM